MKNHSRLNKTREMNTHWPNVLSWQCKQNNNKELWYGMLKISPQIYLWIHHQVLQWTKQMCRVTLKQMQVGYFPVIISRSLNQKFCSQENQTTGRYSTVLESSVEDVVCLSDRDQIVQHRPIKEFDVISGRYSFNRTVVKIVIFFEKVYLIEKSWLLQPKGDRIYNVNDYRFKLNKDTVDRLLYYNKSPSSKNNPNIDRTFVEILLLSVFNVNDLRHNQIDLGLLKIIKG